MGVQLYLELQIHVERRNISGCGIFMLLKLSVTVVIYRSEGSLFIMQLSVDNYTINLSLLLNVNIQL